ncbi:MAG: cytochrome P450 [Synechococcales cyanobacterium RM1_1_8]|nr:cytochrome P450 [Synechococcales cyanobacterium RM1_1_8]
MVRIPVFAAAGEPTASVCLSALGSGGHACIGKRLALMVAMGVVSAIAQQFQVQLVSDQPIEIDPRSTLRPKGGIQVMLKARPA